MANPRDLDSNKMAAFHEEFNNIKMILNKLYFALANNEIPRHAIPEYMLELNKSEDELLRSLGRLILNYIEHSSDTDLNTELSDAMQNLDSFLFHYNKESDARVSYSLMMERKYPVQYHSIFNTTNILLESYRFHLFKKIYILELTAGMKALNDLIKKSFRSNNYITSLFDNYVIPKDILRIAQLLSNYLLSKSAIENIKNIQNIECSENIQNADNEKFLFTTMKEIQLIMSKASTPNSPKILNSKTRQFFNEAQSLINIKFRPFTCASKYQEDLNAERENSPSASIATSAAAEAAAPINAAEAASPINIVKDSHVLEVSAASLLTQVSALPQSPAAPISASTSTTVAISASAFEEPSQYDPANFGWQYR